MSLTVNGDVVSAPDDSRVSLLDLLREHLSKRGLKAALQDAGPTG